MFSYICTICKHKPTNEEVLQLPYYPLFTSGCQSEAVRNMI
jgi:hypothetical protein